MAFSCGIPDKRELSIFLRTRQNYEGGSEGRTTLAMHAMVTI